MKSLLHLAAAAIVATLIVGESIVIRCRGGRAVFPVRGVGR